MIDRDETDADAEARRIPGDIEVDGVLRIADGTICEGDLTAPGGVILGEDVVVQGDIHTDGRVEIGPGSRIDGEVLPVREERLDPLATLNAGPQAAAPASEESMENPPETARESEDRVRSQTLTSTLDVLLTLALQASTETGKGADAGVGTEVEAIGLDEEALADTLEGAYRLIVDLYRDGEVDRPWSPGEVVDVLLKQVFPLVFPVTVTTRTRDAVELTIKRPEPSTHRDSVPVEWTEAVTTFVHEMATTVRPQASLSVQEVGPSVGPAGPEHLRLRLEMGEDRT